MRFVQFRREPAQGVGKMGVGVEKTNGDIIDLSAANPTLPDNMCQLLEQGPTGLDKVKSIVSAGGAPVLPPGTFRLLAPIIRPDKVLCVGMNYHDHCAEIGVPVPTEPVIFNKFPSTIVGPHESIKYPDVTEEADALDYVFGYTVAHDVSARDWQMKNGGQYLLGKAMDTFCPLGPGIVTRDQIEDPHNLGLRTRVNGVLKQDSSTTKIIFKIHTLISHISRFVTLLPGDIILTGTPPGVGGFRKPPEFLQKGDVVECEIDQIGTLTNQIV